MSQQSTNLRHLLDTKVSCRSAAFTYSGRCRVEREQPQKTPLRYAIGRSSASLAADERGNAALSHGPSGSVQSLEDYLKTTQGDLHK